MTERKKNRRGAHFTSEFQRAARANVKRESLQRAGRNGYQSCVEKYGPQFAAERVAAWREANPSTLEQIVAGWLDDLGVQYQREAQACPGVYPDFTLPGHCVIHADGAGWHRGVDHHGVDRAARDRWIDAKLHALGYRALRLSEAEIRDGSGRARLLEFLFPDLPRCAGNDATMLDESLAGHRLHCPRCDVHLTSLLLCPQCGVRYDQGESL